MFSLHGRWLLLVCLLSAFSAAAGSEPTRTDHYGDPLHRDARFRLGTVRLRHDDQVTALAWLPEGRTLASAGWDGTVRLWQIPGGKQLAKWDNLGGVVFSPDGRTLACGVGNKMEPPEAYRNIRILDVATGKVLRRIRMAKNGGTLVNFTPGYRLGFYSPDGKILAIRDRETGVQLYSVESGKQLGQLKAKVLDFGRPVVFTPDSRAVLVSADDGLYRWTIGTNTKDQPLTDIEGTIWSFAFSPNGKLLAAVVSDDKAITLRSWPAGKELRRLPINEFDGTGTNALAFSPDGKLLAASEPTTIRLWDPATGEQVRHFKGLQDKVWDLAFSPDGSLLAAAGRDHAVTVWEVHAGKSPRPLTGVGRFVELVGLAADGQTLLTRSAEDTLTVRNVRDGRRLRTLADGAENIDGFLLGPVGSRKRAALRQEVWKRWNRSESRPERFSYYSYFAISPDNSLLAIGSVQDGTTILFRKTAEGIENRPLDADASVMQARKRRPPGAVCRPAFSPDSRVLAVTYSEGCLILWDTRTGQSRHIATFPKHGETYRSLAFSPDGRLLALSDRSAIYVVETITGQSFWKRPLGEHWIDSFAFAPDNRTLAIGDAGQLAAIHLWDLPTNKEYHTLKGHHFSVEKLVFSPDGTVLLSGSLDKTVLCWEMADILRRRAPSKDLASAKEIELWSELASKDAARGQRAVAEMIQAPDAVLPFVEKSLPPVPPAQIARIAGWIADLDHSEFARRDRATTQLEKIGTLAAPALRKALTEKPSLEMRRRIDGLLEAIDAHPLSPEELRTIRAVQVLETIGTPEARRILEGLAGGAAEALRTQEARAALQRLRGVSEPRPQGSG